MIFFGGTALSRTLLPDGRLSEDIDLIARGSRSQLADQLTAALPRALRREFPGLAWAPSLREVRDVDPAILRSPDGLTVRLQLLDPVGYPNWPVQAVALVQRYSDAPPARLTTPTPPAFAAWKTTAWFDRAAARDLYDLWALAAIDQLTAEAARLFVRYGLPTGRRTTACSPTHPTRIVGVGISAGSSGSRSPEPTHSAQSRLRAPRRGQRCSPAALSSDEPSSS